jgi:uncharacterized protein (TIGR02466 family)
MAQTSKKEPLTGMQSTDYTLEPDTLVWWTTPVLRRSFVNVDAVNQELKELVLERAANTKNIPKSNYGGWHSDEDLLTWGGEAIAQLQQWIVSAFQDLTNITGGGQVYDGKVELNAWANLNRRGDYNIVHTHPACVWSGVYYVETADPPTAEHPKSGVIEFIDPRAGVEMVAVPGMPFSQTKSAAPNSGDIIVFPSWLKHFVHPYWGEGERISIAFNIRIRPDL